MWAEIEGTTITVTLPQGVREESVDLKVNISDGTKVDVVDTTKTYTVTASKDGFVAVKGLTKGFFETDKYTLRVTRPPSRSLTLMPRLCRITP